MIKDYSKYSTIVSFIKELLASFNMPLVQLYINDELTPKIKDRVYIKNESLVKWTGEKFEYISSYSHNAELVNITKKFIIKSSNYDLYTHNYLGDYLRFKRDYEGIDLMCMYNCFFNEQPVAIKKSVKLGESFFKIDSDDQNYNYYLVKSKFNRDYTIAIDCPFPYEVACMLYDVNTIEQEDEDLINSTYTKINGSSFKRPFIYSKLVNKDLNSKYWQKERDLRIIIKLPKVIDSSIVVLEGNYKEAENVIDGVFVGETESLDNNYFREYSKLSLLAYNNKISYPFSDRLVEYLLGNAITSSDDITQNIERVQDDLYKDIIRGYYGLFTDHTRSDIYKQTLKKDLTQGFSIDKSGNKITKTVKSNEIIKVYPNTTESTKYIRRFIDNHYDVTNFVDRDVESLLSLGVIYQDE